MLKELVDFSRELEKNGIYDRIEEAQQKIDKPIMVIPVNDNLSDIDTENIYFVVKNIVKENQKSYLIFDGVRNERKIEIDNKIEFENGFIRKLTCEDEDWQKILINIYSFSKKPSNDIKGNKSIGGNSGTNSYSPFIFEGKIETIFKRYEEFSRKLKDTYTEKYTKSIPDNIESKEQWQTMLNKLSGDNVLNSIWDVLESFFFLTIQKYPKTDERKNPFSSINVILKLPKEHFEAYKEWYECYLGPRVLKTTMDQYPNGNCDCCMMENVQVWLPNAFNNLDVKKPFIIHEGRYKSHNITICMDCALLIYKFQEFFLNGLKISIFPLFLDYKAREVTISLFQNEQNLNKLGFQEIIKQIYQNTSKDVLDFYLIIYNQKTNIIAFDYITGFVFKNSGTDLFKIENYINAHFFDVKLKKHYFSGDISKEDRSLKNKKDLVGLLYRFRSQIFDYVYRANYNSLDNNQIFRIYMASLARKLKEYYSPDASDPTSSIVRMIEVFFKLNKYFGGDHMEKVEQIKQNRKVSNAESFAYFAGQCVYYLFTQSESSTKTHAMVEPFINIRNLNVFRLKFEELFKAYKHKINLNNRRFNAIFSDIWAFLATNNHVQFSDDLKAYFYAGYFDTNDNIFYEKSEK